MKNCGKCKENLPLDAFNKNKSKKDGLATMCRECWKKYYKEYYYNTEKEKLRLRTNNDKKREEIKSFLREYKESFSCTDCGNFYPYYVMDFDHLNDKEFGIAGASRQLLSLEKIKIEIKKCELVCANCHRIRTHNRNQYRVTLSAGVAGL